MTRIRIVGGKLTETTGGDYNIYARESIIFSSATTITEIGVESGVSYGNPEKYSTANIECEIEVKILKNTFLPLGISNCKNKIENNTIRFEVKCKKGKAENLSFYIKHNGTTVFNNKIEATLNSGQKTIIDWDGFSNSKIYDSTLFTSGELIVEITGASNESKDSFKSKYDEVKWVDIQIDKNSKTIDVTLRVNLKDGGILGNDLPKYTFSDLEQMTLEGLNTYWSRNKKRSALNPQTDFVSINNEAYVVNVNPVNTTTNSMDDIDLVYNSKSSWVRSSNPGSVKGVLSFFANIIVPERVVFNAQQRNEERDFKLTSAHEIGHEIIKSFGGEAYSYAHEGSSTLLTQKQKENLRPTESKENNLMEYYSDDYYDYDRTLASEKDVLGLLWCSILKIR